MEPTFLIWIVIASMQMCLFIIYLIKMHKWDKKEIVSKTIDIFPVCNYNGKTYWLEQNSLYREDIGLFTMDIKRAEKVDQLNTKDLSPSEVIYIIDVLER